ncbi:MAG: hypothetical protein KGD67_03915 [Candidatus Lokiarchaeota archaeon]|nr:hypothetical protein [Candidatus Lokiarchaeota archaeon]
MTTSMVSFSQERNCINCKKTISFDKFLLDHPQYSTERALFIWNDELLSIFCPECFLNAPEKPYKQNRYTYFQSYLKS